MLARLKIGSKLLLAPAAVVLLLVLASCASYVAMLGHNRAFELIVHERAARIRQAGALLTEAQQAHANVYQLLTWRSASFSEARVEALTRELRQRHGSIGRRFDALEGSALAGTLEARLLRLGRAAFEGYLHDVRDVMELAQQDHSMSASAMSKTERSFDVVEHHLAGLRAHEQALSERAQVQARADFDAAAMLMPLLVLLAVTLTGAITMAVRSALLRELDAIGAAAHGLGSGNLNVPRRSYGRDEISDTSRVLDASIRNLNRTLRQIRGSALAVDDGSRRLASGLGVAAANEVAPQSIAAPEGTAEGDTPALHAERLARRADTMSREDRQRVRDAAIAAAALQQRALALSRAVAGLDLGQAPPPVLTLAGGLGETTTPAQSRSRGRLRLAAGRAVQE